jgi:hypothetical protein
VDIGNGPHSGDERIRNRSQLFIHDQRELEYGLERRLVPAGEGAARIRRLELGDRQRGFASVVAGERAAVEPAEFVVQDPGECQ